MVEKGNITYIKEYFEKGEHGQKVEIPELKALPLEDRAELGKLAKEALEKDWA